MIGFAWRTWQDARVFVRGMGSRGRRGWHAWAKTADKPADCSANPEDSYQDKGWVNWGDWLATATVARRVSG
jgi:hypothetical protein